MSIQMLITDYFLVTVYFVVNTPLPILRVAHQGGGAVGVGSGDKICVAFFSDL